jgi:hypothetical protein
MFINFLFLVRGGTEQQAGLYDFVFVHLIACCNRYGMTQASAMPRSDRFKNRMPHKVSPDFRHKLPVFIDLFVLCYFKIGRLIQLCPKMKHFKFHSMSNTLAHQVFKLPIKTFPAFRLGVFFQNQP